MMDDEDNLAGDPVCYAHKLVGGHIVDEQTFQDVNRFRKSERLRLVEKRKRLSSEERQQKTAALICRLRILPDFEKARKVAAYWPIRGEPDLRSFMAELIDAGKTVLLPVVVRKDAPVEFHRWYPGCKMTRGVWNIPVPAAAEPDIPDVVLSPLVGVDRDGFRLGNGGGYYDRTLAAFPEKPLVIGVGFAFCRIPTIFPMPWDVPMDIVVTEEGANR